MCESYLYYIHDVGIENLLLDSFPIVYDFTNVFPSDFPVFLLSVILSLLLILSQAPGLFL